MATRFVITGFATLIGTILAGTARWPFQKCPQTIREVIGITCLGMFLFTVVMGPIMLNAN